MKKLLALLILFCFYQIIQCDESAKKPPVDKTIQFDKNTIEAFKAIPILSEGRVKPLNTYASFLLLKINGKRNIRDENGKKIYPMEWFLITLFYPEVAMHQKIFLVDNSEVLESVGFEKQKLNEKQKARDRYSFYELTPYLDKIMTAGDIIDHKDAKARNLLEKQTLQLAMNLYQYINVMKTLDFARPMDDTMALGKKLDKPSRFIIAEMIQIQKQFIDSKEVKELSEEKQKMFKDEIDNTLVLAIERIQQSKWLTIFPPADPKDKVWRSPYELYIQNQADLNGFDSSAIFTAFEDVCMSIRAEKETPEKFTHLATTLNQQINKYPIAQEHLIKTKMENSYYKLDLIYNSLKLYVFVFLSICFSFMKPKAKIWNTANISFIIIPTLLLTGAITLRCLILSRPPVATLYETILFITAVICIVGVFIEYVFKNRIALFATSVVGTGGLFLSYAYESSDGTDTMGNLAAVLNSNFWLSTHVTAVTIGYSAGLLASVFAHIYIISKVLRLTSDPEYYKTLNKIIYGVLCFCIVFATIGTILGGIWANYSWGRFWGWDPKENGALAIVLWTLIILHGRIGGIFKEFGIAIMTVIGGMVVVASWWGVNQLGVGLHSYGFTDGIVMNLAIFAILEIAFISVGFFHHYVIERLSKTQKE